MQADDILAIILAAIWLTYGKWASIFNYIFMCCGYLCYK